MDARQLIEMDLADTIIDRPHGFSVGSRHFYLYPVTLGKMYLLGRLIEQLEMQQEIIKVNPYLEAYRIVKTHKDICAHIVTYHTIRTKAKIFDNEFVLNRKKFIVENCDDKDLAKLMVMVLTSDKTDSYIKHLKLDKEQKRIEQVSKAKETKNTFNFGGLSVYGSLIDAACERYGWTFDYVVWEISYTNLKLLLADSQKQVYLTDDERKKCRISNDRVRINGDNAAEAWAAINAERWD